MAHSHNHSHAMPSGVNRSRIFLVGILLNLSFSVIEAIVGFASHSLALITDAGHNLSDVSSLALSFIALKLADRKSNHRFTYGLKKSTIFAALANAIMLLIAIGILGYEAVLRFLDPQPMKGGTMAWVAGIGIVINAGSALLFYRDKHELNSRSAFLHLITDALVSVAVVLAGIAIMYTQWYWLDSAMSLIVLVVIIWSTWGLLVDSLRLSMDAVPPGIDLDDIVGHMKEVKGVRQVEHVHIWALSTTQNAMTAHVATAPELSANDKAEVLADIKEMLKNHGITHATLELIRDSPSGEDVVQCT